jgi:subtilisin family serine protease
VGACSNNGLGIAGMAPNVRLMPVKVLDDSGSGGYDAVAAGIEYAVDNGAKIINLSLGGSSPSNTMYNAVRYAYDHNVLVLAAAGNYAQSGNPIVYPAAYDEAMAVAATDSGDNHASFSEYHPYVEIAAPGVSIYSTVNNGGYQYLSGTSMATPHVAGLAALIWSMAPGYTANQIRAAINASAVDLGAAGRDDYYGYGRIDAFNALDEFLVLALTQSSSGEPVNTLAFLADDQSSDTAVQQVTLTANIAETVNWQVQLSPAVDWVSITSVASGQITAAATGADVTLTANRPATYGTYHTTLIITGSTDSGINFAPVHVDVAYNYLPELQRYYFPLIFR